MTHSTQAEGRTMATVFMTAPQSDKWDACARDMGQKGYPNSAVGYENYLCRERGYALMSVVARIGYGAETHRACAIAKADGSTVTIATILAPCGSKKWRSTIRPISLDMAAVTCERCRR